MKKAFKIIGIVIAIILVLMILIPFLFKGKIKTKINQAINENLNAKVEFKRVGLSLFKAFPDLRAEIKKLTIVGIDTFALDTLVVLDKFGIDINLFSIFGDQIEINSIIITKPVIKALVLEDGRYNWDIMKVDTAAVEPVDTATSTMKLSLEKVVITDGYILYDDQSLKMSATLKELNYLMKGNLTGDLLAMKNKLTVKSFDAIYEGVKYMNNATLDGDADIDADLAKFKFSFKNNSFKLNALELGLDGWLEMPDTNINMDLTYLAKKAEFKHFLSLIPAIYMNDFSGLEASGKAALTGYVKGTYNAISMPLFGVDILVENGKFKYPDLPKSVENVNVKVKVDSRDDKMEYMDIDISKFHVEMAGNPFDVSMFIGMTPNDMALKGAFNGKLDLASVADVIPLDSTTIGGLLTTDLKINGKLSAIENEKYEEFQADGKVEMANFKFDSPDVPRPVGIQKALLQFSPQFVELANLDLTLGSSDFRLKGRVENFLPFVFSDGTVKGNLTLNSTLINTNELLSDETATVEPTDTTSITAFEIPKNIDFTFNSNIGKILYDKLEITDVLGIVVVQAGKAMLQNLKMNLLQGSLVLNGFYDSKDVKNPEVDFGMNINGFDIPATFNAFNTIQRIAPIAKRCTGKISLQLAYKSLLNYYMMPQMPTINGKGRLQSNDIAISNAPVFDKIADKLKNEELRNPTLRNIDVGFTITDGNIEIEPFSTKIAGREIRFRGKQGVDKSIDYFMNTTIPVDKAAGLFTNLTGLKTNKDIDIELNVGGTLTDPKVVGIKSNAAGEVKDQVMEKIEEKKQEIKKELSDRAKKLIEDADARADKLLKEAEIKADQIRENARKLGEAGIKEADEQGKKLIAKATNPLTKKAAEKGAEKLSAEARKKADDLNNEAEKQATDLLEKARSESDKIKQQAREQAERLE